VAGDKNQDKFEPADAIKVLQKALEDGRLQHKKKHVATDIADLHLPFTDDDGFTAALLAIAREIQIALRNPGAYGKPLSGNFSGLRRAAFPPLRSKRACLRLVIEPLKDGSTRIHAFRHRHNPPNPYSVVGQRSKDA
jgi:hypothetical protein